MMDSIANRSDPHADHTNRPLGDALVSIIIVNYNGRHFLDDCLQSLLRQTLPMGVWETIVVDNASTDGSVEHVERHYPWVQVIRAGRNLGFAAGNNEGFKRARGRLIALLNNDTIVEDRWLEALVEAISEDDRIGGATSKILLQRRPGIINSTGLNLYEDGRGGDRGFEEKDEGQYDQPADVFGGCGASLLLRREMLDDVGWFDERFFMYYEDLDLAWRAQSRGWRFRYTPASVVHHIHCGTSGEWSPFFLFFNERNRVFVNVKNARAKLAIRALAVFCARAVRKWFRVATFQDRGEIHLQQGFAYLNAIFSLVAGLPGMLKSRFEIRVRRRLVPDREFAHLVASTAQLRKRAA